MRFEGGFEFGPPCSALYAGRLGGRVDLEHPVHAAYVQADDAVEPLADVGGDPAYHRRAAAVGDQGRAPLARPFHQRRRLGLAARVGDRVGGMAEVAGEDPDRIGLRLPEAVQYPFVGLLGADRGQPGRGVQAGRPEADFIDRRRPAAARVAAPDAEAAGQGR